MRKHNFWMIRKTATAVLVGLGLVAIVALAAALADCPDAGSGKTGVDAWAANCGTCENPATTCNEEFTIELTDVSYAGDLVTFEYEICQIDPNASSLSHWIIGLGQIDCLAEGFTLSDLVVGATLDGAPVALQIGVDPTTQINGVKFDQGVGDKECHTWSITFDTSVLNDGYTLCADCVLAATKAGNQDIRADQCKTDKQGNVTCKPSPGYACILGPVCCQECEWFGETAWASGTRYVDQGNWATYTPYVADSTVTLYAGQTLDAGTVHFSQAVDGFVTITITLNAGWRFAPVDENVKIQDYATAPSGNPSPGGFAHKDTALGSPFSIVVPESNFYGVHVDVEECR